jgi:hypothetical protein
VVIFQPLSKNRWLPTQLFQSLKKINIITILVSKDPKPKAY